VSGAAGSPGEATVSLYVSEAKIQPRAVHGWFAAWRWAVVWITQLVFYGLPWIEWNGRPALLFDLAARRFYVLGLVLHPQDFIYLAGLLIVSAYALFLFTTVAGRLWCGYASPQTVYTEVFMWIERQFEGERMARLKMDKAPWSFRKAWRRGGKHAVWLALGLWTGFTFVAYFTPAPELASQAAGLALGPWQTFWILFYGLATYGNAGWMREQVCKYMCPYARFQSAMFDKDTLIITYDEKRGEPRGKGEGKGDCIDCGICVQVCPTGIDIRQGLQYECIGCAACIDGCDQVMEKLKRPAGLIRYSTTHALEGTKTKVVRPRVLVYTAILLSVAIAAGVSLYIRVPLKLDVIRDRAAIAREVEGGLIENVYRLQVMNTTEQARAFELSVSGLPGIELWGDPTIGVGAATSRMVLAKVRLPADAAKPGSHRIEFHLRALGVQGVEVREHSVFIVQ